MMIIFLVLALSATCIAADYMKYCGSEECDPNYQPVPNIFTAMTGYNILKGNPMPEAGNQLKDPGFTGLSYLFVPTVKNSQDRYTLDDGLTVRELRNFASSLESEVIRNTKEYQKSLKTAASHDQDFATNLEYDVSATLPVGPAEVGVQTTVPPMAVAAFGSNSGFRKNERFFTEEEGILVFAKAKLISYTLTVSKTKPPRFHPGFIAMLSELQEAGNGDNREKDAKLKKLIDNFGTHYLRNVDMGARIAITKRYDRKEAMRTTQEEIQQCTKSSLNIFFGLVNTASSKCKTTIESRHSRWTRTYKRKFITSFGSKPNHDLMAWANQEIDKPVPIQMTLEPIVNLFTKTFMGNMTNCNDGLGVEIDYKSILKWMLPKYLSYCEEHKRELRMSTCDIQNVEAKGCGLNDDCEFDQICKNDRNNRKGYYCEDQSKIHFVLYLFYFASYRFS